MASSGQPIIREELTEYLRSRLIECGWRDQVANMCRTFIQKNGVEQVRLEQIVCEVRAKARQKVPDQIKTELLEMIRKLSREQTPAKVDDTTFSVLDEENDDEEENEKQPHDQQAIENPFND